MIKLLGAGGVIVLFGLFVMYNHRILVFLAGTRERSENIFYRLLGRRVKKWNINVERASSLKRGSLIYKINRFFKEMINNLGLTKDNVTPVGLLTFISSIALAFSIFFIAWSKEFMLFLPAFASVFFFVVVLFNFFSLLRYEKKEAEIMDTEDLIAMDIKGGVYNAILRYRHSFHPNIQPYFEEFVDNIQNKGYGFRQAMQILNDRLGASFTDFAQKAILYEEKADKDMEDIFSSVVEMNRYKRTLRYENNVKFNKLRFEFIVSIVIISGYGLFSVTTDPFIANFLQNTLLGKMLLLVDIVAVTGVLAYIASIKAKFL